MLKKGISVSLIISIIFWLSACSTSVFNQGDQRLTDSEAHQIVRKTLGAMKNRKNAKLVADSKLVKTLNPGGKEQKKEINYHIQMQYMNDQHFYHQVNGKDYDLWGVLTNKESYTYLDGLRVYHITTDHAGWEVADLNDPRLQNAKYQYQWKRKIDKEFKYIDLLEILLKIKNVSVIEKDTSYEISYKTTDSNDLNSFAKYLMKDQKPFDSTRQAKLFQTHIVVDKKNFHIIEVIEKSTVMIQVKEGTMLSENTYKLKYSGNIDKVNLPERIQKSLSYLNTK